MKKLLGIVVLGLLWCSISIAETLNYVCKYKAADKKINIQLNLEKNEIKYDNKISKIVYKTLNQVVFMKTQYGYSQYEVFTYSPRSSAGLQNFMGSKKTPVAHIIKMFKKGGPTSKPFATCYGNQIAQEPEKKEPTPDDKLLAASSGSGFFVTRTGHLVTNYHVVEECDAVKVSFNAKEIQADIIAIDKFNDLAIIKGKINPTKVFPVSNKDVSLLQDIIVAGFPLGKRISAAIKTHKGSVTGLAGIGDNYSNFQTDATINHGNSGGPILTQKGNVIGVAVQLIPPDKAQNIFFGVKSSTLTTFAKANKVNFLPPNTREMSNEDLGELITEATVFLECWMTIAKIKRMYAEEDNRKAFYSEFE